MGYVVTPADVVVGSVDNVATVTGDDGNPDTQNPTGTSGTTTPTGPVPTPGIAVDKSSSGEVVQVGDTISYSFVVTNTGNVPLSSVTLSDPLCTPELVSGDDGDAVLSTTEVWTYACDYTVTSEDLADGEVVNTVSVTADDGDPATENPQGGDTASNPVEGTPSMTLDKTVVAAGGACPGVDSLSIATAGDVTFCYVVTNTGNVALSSIEVLDDMATPADPSDDVTIPVPMLEPGEMATVTHTVTLDQAFLDAGTALTNRAGDELRRPPR